MTRLSVNINNETASDLRELAERRGMSLTETVRRAVAVLDFLEGAQRDGQRIQVVGNETLDVRIL